MHDFIKDIEFFNDAIKVVNFADVVFLCEAKNLSCSIFCLDIKKDEH